ncbi:4-hydroxy-tetrahydrodipicolinate synthase [Paenibacillus antri]|uniref:4-hydroxy-tetrahydrodipicolinate synthase n=1 Tax=Paenibacillus antri TaxID=2582848 RepID=A0A5R9G5N9_9BACL|nr:4-hydroxy-tetrahydrodipicolinate synthase [Paenibacillus antri]TLS51687.1 4-hydroxy-tetrahydrodipicolinate synthase [Paenibacillus antri]
MLQSNDLKGIFVPVVTPFTQDGELDLPSFERYLGQLLRHPIQGIVINGTTGEAPTVEWAEVEALFEVARTVIRRLGVRTPIIVGTGTNDTRTTVRRTAAAGEWGADAVLVVTPYYSRPSEEGTFRHFQAVVETGTPLVAYEVPERTGIRLSAETMERILTLDGVIGLKDATGGIDLLHALAGRTEKPMMAGSDDTFARMLRRGASGGILASAQFRTEAFLEVNRLAANGLFDEAEAAFSKLLPLTRLLFRETNPSPIKWMLAQSGILASDEVRLPLTPITRSLQEELSAFL